LKHIQIETAPVTAPANGDYHGVWSLPNSGTETQGVSYELLARVKSWRNPAHGALLRRVRTRIDAASLSAYGAEKVYLVDSPDFVRNPEDIYYPAAYRPHPAIQTGGCAGRATALGRLFIPRVAAVLGTGLTADCTGLEIDMKDKLLYRPAHLPREHHGDHHHAGWTPADATVRPVPLRLSSRCQKAGADN